MTENSPAIYRWDWKNKNFQRSPVGTTENVFIAPAQISADSAVPTGLDFSIIPAPSDKSLGYSRSSASGGLTNEALRQLPCPADADEAVKRAVRHVEL